VRCRLKSEGELYQFGLGSAAMKLHPHRTPIGASAVGVEKPAGTSMAREARQSSDNAVAVFLKRSPNGKDQTFLIGIHQRIQ